MDNSNGPAGENPVEGQGFGTFILIQYSTPSIDVFTKEVLMFNALISKLHTNLHHQFSIIP